MFPKHELQTPVQTPTYLSKVNHQQTILFVQEAQSCLQEQLAKELFEQKNRADFLDLAVSTYQTNAILTEFIEVLGYLDNHLDTFKVKYKHFLQSKNRADVYDAIEDAFCFYFLSSSVDIENFIAKRSKKALQEHYNDVKDCYKEIVKFVKRY